jgi:hypothetical protein
MVVDFSGAVWAEEIVHLVRGPSNVGPGSGHRAELRHSERASASVLRLTYVVVWNGFWVSTSLFVKGCRQ